MSINEDKIPLTIEVGVYYYISDDNKIVYDTEEMVREFENKLKELPNE
jgi:hypothetical protein